MQNIIWTPGELIRGTFFVASNDGASAVDSLTDTDFTKVLLQDGVLDQNITVEVSHRSSGLYLVSFSATEVGYFDLLLTATIGGIIRRWLWDNILVEPFGTKNLGHAAFGSHVKIAGNPNIFRMKDYDGQVIAEYEITDTERVRTL